LLRQAARALIRQDAVEMEIDPAAWHTYVLEWQERGVSFRVDGQEVLNTPIAPIGPLGFVLWIDNQYAAFTPEGELKFGSLANARDTWLEVELL
jgi:hypothetical protein